jgi:arylformamidase
MPRHTTAWLESQYNNRALVPGYAEHFARWRAASAAALNTPCVLDVAYGPAAGDKLDLFPAATGSAPGTGGAPVLVFIHGGYWRSLDKADHRFVAPPFVAQGACVVVPNYDLCPSVTVPDITLQMVRALAWVHRHIAGHGGDPNRVTVVGHSAGGHLAAMLLLCQWQAVAPDLPEGWLTKAVSLSGLYDLSPIRQAPFLQADLRLTPRQVTQASPAHLPAPRSGTLWSLVGGHESDEFHRQNALIRQAWGPRRVPVCEALPGLNHFSIVEALVDPGHALHSRVAKWVLARDPS